MELAKLDLTKYKFPEVNKIDIAFPTFNTIPELLEEAKNRGFLHGHTTYNIMFSTLFFTGGKVNFKDDIDENFKTACWGYGSFSPQHEHKEAVCAMLMSEVLKPELQREVNTHQS
jgi:hypothetical protein